MAQHLTRLRSILSRGRRLGALAALGLVASCGGGAPSQQFFETIDDILVLSEAGPTGSETTDTDSSSGLDTAPDMQGLSDAEAARDTALTADADALATDSGSADAVVAEDYFPPNDSDAWETADAEANGWSVDGLDALIQVVKDNRSSSFMLLSDGRIIVERYFLGADASATYDVASVQKSVTSTLMGLARDKGLLAFDDAVSDYLEVGWSNATPTQEAEVTLRHLMTHSSGLSPTELTRVAAPGSRFTYNTNAYQKLRGVLEHVAGTDINTLSQAWLFDAIGIRGVWEDRGGVDPTGAAIWGLKLSARDMARFGLFAQRFGVWAGEQITKVGWFEEAWTPSEVKADYGLLWWLQGRGALDGKAPRDLVSALGARDQKIYIVPSLRVVVTRQGLAPGVVTEAESDFDVVLANAISAARVGN